MKTQPPTFAHQRKWRFSFHHEDTKRTKAHQGSWWYFVYFAFVVKAEFQSR
jgi:hypothetical protein